MKTKLLLSITLVLSAFIVNAQKGAPINLITYNIRLNTTADGENAWPNRKDNVKALIKFYDTEILCVQEALPLQVDEILDGSDFAVEGAGRDDGMRKGEHSSIYYNKRRFIKKDGGTFWLSETPDQPSKGWDAALNRVCTWLRLYDKINKKEFIIFNTHYDHVGKQARIESAELIKEKIQKISANLPVVLTGDLNVKPDTEAIQTLKSFLRDSREISEEPPYGPEGTLSGFSVKNPIKGRIDYVFVNKGFNVKKYGVLTDNKDLNYFSDHLPVLVRLSF